MNPDSAVKAGTNRELIALKAGVPADAEFLRIEALPRRAWTKRQARRAAREMTARLRKPHGQQELWTDQAVALSEIEWYGGIVGGIKVSGGKTLISLLAPTLLSHLRNPLLLTPSKSIKSGKVLAAYKEAAEHWNIRSDIQWCSYELLQRKEYANYLEKTQTQLIILDEAHHAGRHNSSRTKRIERYLRKHPDCVIIVLSGSLIASRVVDDSARLCYWALRDDGPLPRSRQTQRFWRLALETPVKAKPGALRRFCNDGELTLEGVGRRYRETPAVCISNGKDLISSALVCETELVTLKNERVLEAFANIRAGREPGGDASLDTDGGRTWLTAQTLALGFYYVLDPTPPSDWLDAMRNWASYCREYIADERNDCDTEAQVIAELEDSDEVPWPWGEWRDQRYDHKLTRKAVWLGTERLDAAREWMRAHKHGIVWTQFRAFGRELARHAPYYGAHARDVGGDRGYITDHKRGTPCAASIKVCSEDLNLQHTFHQNLFVAPPATGAWLEQAIARTHRFGQKETEVTAHFWLACAENAANIQIARLREKQAARMDGHMRRKLLIADWIEHNSKIPSNDAWKTKRIAKALIK